MATLNGIKKMAENAFTRAALAIVRTALVKVIEGGKGQVVEVEAYGERYKIEMLSNYGHSYWAPAGAETVMSCPSGDLSQGVVTGMSHRSSRVPCQQEGDNIIYHMDGHKIYLQKNGVISIIPTGAGKVHVGALVAALAAARVTDPVASSAPMATWMTQITTAITQIATYVNGMAPGSVTPAGVPPASIGIISSGSAKVNVA